MDLDEKIKQAELRKLEIETEKLLEEKSQIKFENDDRIKKSKLPFYKSQGFLKIFFGLVLGIPFVFTYVKLLIIPSLEIENIKLAQELNDISSELNQKIEKERHLLDSISDKFLVYDAILKIDYLEKLLKNELKNSETNEDIKRKWKNVISIAFENNMPAILNVDSADYNTYYDVDYMALKKAFYDYNPAAPASLRDMNRKKIESQISKYIYELKRPYGNSK